MADENVVEQQTEAPSVPILPDVEQAHTQINIDGLMENVGINPLMSAAEVLLAGLVQLKRHPVAEDMHVFQQDLIREFIKFETKAKQLQLNDETISDARYILCACYDEVILNYCRDKAEAELDQSSLISVFYQETSGGENAFALLEKLLKNPNAHVDLLELFLLCLYMGFEGKYHVMRNGREKLKILRDQVYRAIRKQRGDYSKELFIEIVAKKAPKLRKPRITTGMVIGITAIALVVIGFGFNYALLQAIKPVISML